MTHYCPLCCSRKVEQACEVKKTPYLSCTECKLIYVPEQFHLTPDQEKSIYDQHENDPTDQGYRNFLNRLMTPLLNHIPPESSGLDFGCGPGPTLSVMLEELGHSMTLYDPYFAQNETALLKHYDFVTSTEVVEHLSKPREVFKQLFEMVNFKGVIGIMTKLIPTDIPFEKWHYIKDPTHITFYAEETCHYLAEQFGYRAKIVRSDVILFLPSDRG